MLKNNIGKITFTLAIVLISLLIVFTTVFLSQNSALIGDDTFATYNTFGMHINNWYLNLQLNNIYYKFHGGGLTAFLMTTLFCMGIPVSLNIHPMDFMNYPVCFLMGFTNVIILLFISKFSVLYNKSKLIFISVFCLLFVYFLYQIYRLTGLNVFLCKNLYFRYPFSLFSFGILWFYIYKNSIQKNKINYFILFIICILTAATVTSLEIAAYITLLLLTALILNNILFSVIAVFNKNNKDNIKDSCLYNLGINFYIIYFTACISCFLYHQTLGYKILINERGLNNISVTFATIKEFTKQYFDIYFIHIKLYWIIAIILTLICFIYAVKNKELKKVLFPVYFMLSTSAVIYSLIACGKTYYGDNNYWLVSGNIQFFYKMLFLFPLLILFDYFLSNIIKNLRIKNFVIIGSIFIMLIFSGILSYKIYKYIQDLFIQDYINYYQQNREYIYKTEKIFRFNILNNNKVFHLPYPINRETIYLFHINMFTNEEITEDCTQDMENSYFLTIYYPSVYKENNNSVKSYCFSNNAIDEFYKAGGTFSSEELKNIKFSRLFDKDFVLNKKL